MSLDKVREALESNNTEEIKSLKSFILNELKNTNYEKIKDVSLRKQIKDIELRHPSSKEKRNAYIKRNPTAKDSDP